MAGFKELIDANTSFRESLNEQADISQAASYLNDDEKFDQKFKFLKLLEAKRYLLEAHLIKDTPEVTTSVLTEGNVLENLQVTTEKIVAERALMKFIATSVTVKELFSKPELELTSELLDKKNQIRKLLQELASEEVLLTSLQDETEVAETHRNRVLRVWDETLAKLRDKASGVDQNDKDGDDQTELPGKRKLQEVISRMDIMKSLIAKFITSKPYDWITDRANLKPLLLITREKFTTEMFDE